MNPTARTLFNGLLVLLAFLLFAALLLVGNYLLSPRPANAQSVALQTAPLKWSEGGLKLELQAMPLDLVRAFFLGRGFKASDAELIAKTGCIYRAALGNSGTKADDPSTVIELAKWQIIGPNGPQTIRARQDWATIWDKKKISDSAKVAFHWALFPTRQGYQSSDYNWGMISFALPPGTRFDLEIHWLSGNVEKTKMLKNMECGK